MRKMDSLRSLLNLSLAGIGALILFSGCSDPANDVAQTSASAPQQTASPSTAEPAGKAYALAADSEIGFVGSKVTGSHSGGFKDVTGTLSVAEGKIVGTPKFTIDMNSTWSDSDRLTGHLKNADFFDVEQFPTSTFEVTLVEESDTEQTVTGNLTLHGVTKSISFPAQMEISEETVTIQAEFAINRQDFGISYPGRSDDLIRDRVVIKLDLKAVPSV